ncbi:MAG: AtpZ/AtpI family protein [Candidatus Brocadia sp.]|nr:AtpZ/AtpI family protein [Candidatus Brocadia sp.]NUO07088.1 AtpZ/AtpI family protein [Candidatus Brocadia sp.]
MLFNKNKNEAYRIIGSVGSFGFTTAGAMAGGYFLGSYLDKKFNTTPWCMLSLMMLGIVGSFIELFKLIKKLSRENNR